jgi:hypothetical protein
MCDASRRNLQGWTEQVLRAIEACIDGSTTVDVRRLADDLLPLVADADCPHASDVLDSASTLTYRRIPLTGRAACGYEALLIVWPPGHATPIHDHDGLWGIEFVLDGALEVEAFSLSLRDTPHLVSQGATILGVGDHTAFSDADYAHRCRNLSQRLPTLSLHVYGGELDTYRSFHQQDGDCWTSTVHRTARETSLT